MNEERVRQIVRQFQENGLKQVLTNPANVRDALGLGRATMLPRIDFAGLQVDPTTYVTAEYRHVSSDLVLSVPLLPSRRGARRKRLLLTILIELQAQPDRLMPLRVLEYLVQIWKHQVRQHGQKHGSLASVKLQPVLPLVLHTGSYPWENLGSLLDLMDDAEDFGEVTPRCEPLFVSLPDVPDAELETRGGYFGQILALLKARKATQSAFGHRLARTVTKLQELTGPERQRRLELLSYVEALVYHSRAANDHKPLRERIDAALRNDEARLEVDMVRKTMAQVEAERYMREGALAEKKRTLLELLGLRWGPLPAGIEQAIETNRDANQLTEWLRRFATAKDLDAVGIIPKR